MLRLWLRSMLFILLRLKLGQLGLFLGGGMGGTGSIGPRMWGRNEVEPGYHLIHLKKHRRVNDANSKLPQKNGSVGRQNAQSLEELAPLDLIGSHKDQLRAFRHSHTRDVLKKQLFCLHGSSNVHPRSCSPVHLGEKEVMMKYCHHYWLHFENSSYKRV